MQVCLQSQEHRQRILFSFRPREQRKLIKEKRKENQRMMGEKTDSSSRTVQCQKSEVEVTFLLIKNVQVDQLPVRMTFLFNIHNYPMNGTTVTRYLLGS